MLIDFGQGRENKRRAKIPLGDNAPLYRALAAAKARSNSTFVIEYRGRRVLDIKKGVGNAFERAGIHGCTVHTLKHTAITWMVQAGTSFDKIAKLTGTSSRMIEKRYGHHSPEFLAEVGEVLTV